MLIGYQPNENWNIYVRCQCMQSVNGSVKLRGELYSVLNGYDLETGTDWSWGWLAGAAYQIPEISPESLNYISF